MPINKDNKWDEVLDSSEQLYVEVLENNSSIFKEPSLNGQEINSLKKFYLILYTVNFLFPDCIGTANAAILKKGLNSCPPPGVAPRSHLSMGHAFFYSKSLPLRKQGWVAFGEIGVVYNIFYFVISVMNKERREFRLNQ